MKKYIYIALISILMFSGCEDIIDPAIENFKDIEQMYTNSGYAQGFIVSVYGLIPGYYDNNDYATDDAVTNQLDNNYLKMATGSWTASNNPVNQWDRGFSAIQYINLFLENVDEVHWADDTLAADLFNSRMKGEAFGLRALFMYHLLRSHAGFTSDGRLMGVPILTEFQDPQSDFNNSRATFEECVQQIYRDLDSADLYLPFEYETVKSEDEIPERFWTDSLTVEQYNRVMGHFSRQLFNGLIAQSIRSRTSLLAASPAFQDPGNTTGWEDAANAAAVVVDYWGGPSGLAANGHLYYTKNVDNLSGGKNPPEIIWRENISTNNTTQESQNFPPTLFGSGNMNPTQNLVNAFPMENGYPISDANAVYNPSNPYAERDPRLSAYIIYDSSIVGTSNSLILTGSQSGTDDGINMIETSTRTGYYMKKRLRMDVNVNPSSITGKTHYTPRIRSTEIYLNYAEAANEAWGPTGQGSHSYSAYDIINAIRKRAGVGVNNGDPYLEECRNDKGKMRELIRNERRLELCFEGFRFWDIRRWKVNLNETAKGMNPSSSYTVFDVEKRSYSDYMFYGPIPYSEILKYRNLEQNQGWE